MKNSITAGSSLPSAASKSTPSPGLGGLRRIFTTPDSAVRGIVCWFLALYLISLGLLLLALLLPAWKTVSLILAGLLAGVFLLACPAAVTILHHHLDEQLHDVSGLFASVDAGDISLARSEFPANSPATRGIFSLHDRFLARLRTIITNIRQIGIDIAVDSTKIASSVNTIARKTSEQKGLSEIVFTASHEANNAIREVSKSTQYVSGKTSDDLQMAQTSYQELVDVAGKVAQINQAVDSFRITVEDLGKSSKNILRIVDIINDIAEQTGLLSLNATIEAARAGEHGRGFAVVAEEVRELAKRIRPATGEITKNVNEMISIVQRTQEETADISDYAVQTGTIVGNATENFQNMVADFEIANEELMKIASAIEELATNNNEVTNKVKNIHDLSQDIALDMEESAGSVKTLHTVTEKMLAMVSAVRTGEGKFDDFINFCSETRDIYAATLKKVKDSGIHIFDRNYQKVPQTNPQKYVTSYTDRLATVLQPILDERLALAKGAIYCLAIDCNGYIAIHHKKVSQPMTGDPARDLLHSRHQRIFFSNATEQRRCTNSEPMLLQTYMRDTGEILSDLSMPIIIDGKHWGAMITGFDAKMLV